MASKDRPEPEPTQVSRMTQRQRDSAERGSGSTADEVAVTLLVVGLDDTVLTVIRRMLERRGFRTLLARCLDDVRAAVAANYAGISGVVLDLAMPGIDAEAAFRALRRARPTLPVLLTGGYSEDAVAARLAASLGTRFLAKPFGLDALGRIAAELFGAASSRTAAERGGVPLPLRGLPTP